MTVSTIKMTARQFLQLGEDPPGVRLELVDGEVAVSPSPIPDHSYVVGTLYSILRRNVDEHDLGQLFLDVDTVLSDHDVRRPDILFFSKSRLHLVGDKAMEGAPDLVIEVVSPGSIHIDRKGKARLYASAKVKSYWIVDPQLRTVEAFQLRAGRYVLRGRGAGQEIVHLPPFPDLKIPVAELWRPK